MHKLCAQLNWYRRGIVVVRAHAPANSFTRFQHGHSHACCGEVTRSGEARGAGSNDQNFFHEPPIMACNCERFMFMLKNMIRKVNDEETKHALLMIP